MTAKQEEGEIAADVAAKVYQALRQAFPEVGFRVIHRGYADTSRHFPYVSIWWHHDGPEVETVQAQRARSRASHFLPAHQGPGAARPVANQGEWWP